MKNAIMIFLFSVECFISYSQNGFLFQPQVGIGVSKMNPIDPFPDSGGPGGYVFDGRREILTFNIEAKLAYQLGHFRIISGLQFIRTGSPGNMDEVSVHDIVLQHAAYEHYDHLLIPISLGYNIILINKWSFTPELGTNIIFIKENERDSWFSNSDKSLLSVKMNFERKINDNLCIVITPAFFKINNPVYSRDSWFWVSVNEMFLLQAGILWHFSHKAKSTNEKKTITENK